MYSLQSKIEEEMNEISIKGLAYPKWKLYPFTTHHCVRCHFLFHIHTFRTSRIKKKKFQPMPIQ